MPRPRKPDAKTPAERNRSSRQRRAVCTIEVPRDFRDRLTVIRNKAGDATLAAALARIVMQSGEG